VRSIKALTNLSMPIISGNTSGAFGTFCVFFIATDTTGHISTRHISACHILCHYRCNTVAALIAAIIAIVNKICYVFIAFIRFTYYIKFRNYTCFLSSPFFKVIVFTVSHFSHFAPKSVIFQKAWGVR
jgi:hypothetical protein